MSRRRSDTALTTELLATVFLVRYETNNVALSDYPLAEAPWRNYGHEMATLRSRTFYFATVISYGRLA